MDEMTILKIQNTINETQNLLSKQNFDESNYYELKTWKKLLENYVNL